MKTHKLAMQQAKLIRDGQYPDIGRDYHRVLSDASRGGYLKSKLHDAEWLAVFPDMVPITKTLQKMGLIGTNFQLTKMGQRYKENFGQFPSAKRHDSRGK